MLNNGQTSIIRPDLVRELRAVARRGTTVRELTEIIQKWVGCDPHVVIPVLAGFVHAFRLPLIKVLPIRDWIGMDHDEEINALIMPEIEKMKELWDGEELAVSSLEPEVGDPK